MISVSLPFPPGVNNLFNNVPGRGRVPTPKYKAWRSDAAICIMAARQKPLAGRFHATLTYDRPDNRRRDLDGVVKAPLDALVRAGLIEDDHLAQRITLEWGEPKAKAPMVHIFIAEAA